MAPIYPLAEKQLRQLRSISLWHDSIPVMTIATRNAPRNVAITDSHHVRPSDTKEATVAHPPGEIRSATQSEGGARQNYQEMLEPPSDVLATHR